VAESSGGIAALGIDARSLLFQVINFGVLLVLLKMFAYKPILKVLQQRQQTIEESLKNAKLVEENKRKMEDEHQAVLVRAHQEAKDIVAKGERRAQEVAADIQKKAQEQAERSLEEAQSKMTQQAQEIKSQLKQETLMLVAAATEKIIHEKLDPEKDSVLITTSLKHAEEIVNTRNV
jgi:F-type H+-transporting ATPase subunit b